MTESGLFKHPLRQRPHGAPVFRDEDFVADFDVELDLLAIVVELAGTDGYDRPFLRLLFRRVGNMMPPFLTFFSSSG